MLVKQIKYDLMMFFREIFYLIFTVVVPPVSYILMGQMFGSETYAGGMNYAEQYTPSFIILIGFSVVFFAFGFDQVMNRAGGIEKRLFITPITDRIVLLSSIVKSFIIASAGFFLIAIIGILLYNLEITPFEFLGSYAVLLMFNALMLIFSQALYSNFQEVKTALVTSIIMFQIVMFTGGFSIPVNSLPDFMQVFAKINPIYHLNTIYVLIWNQNFEWSKESLISIGYLIVLTIISLFVIKFNKKRG